MRQPIPVSEMLQTLRETCATYEITGFGGHCGPAFANLLGLNTMIRRGAVEGGVITVSAVMLDKYSDFA
ncbi:hypothetical protein FRB93_006727 [Tulasnella sp. JGI-2019a]|nr:hypothetical protein FRB93_006727 [Tulasnella sp. JGI-2019a]